MGPKKKGNAKKGQQSTPNKSASVEAADLDESIILDDDGTISVEDIVEICKCLLATGKQLQRNFAAFVETFKNRCSLTIGCVLLTYHEYLSDIEDDTMEVYLLQRVVIIYFLYRIRDIEPSIKRKAENKNKESIIGHTFLEFFLSMIPSTAFFRVPNPHLVETRAILMILSNQAFNFGTPQESIDSLRKGFAHADNIWKDVCGTFEHRMKLWPESAELRCSPAVMIDPLPPPKYDPLPVDVQRLSLESLVKVGRQVHCDDGGVPTLPFLNYPYSHSIPVPFPVTENEILHEPFAPDVTSEGYVQQLKSTITSDDMLTMVAEIVNGQFMFATQSNSEGVDIDDSNQPSTSTATESTSNTAAVIVCAEDEIIARMEMFTDKMVQGGLLTATESKEAYRYIAMARGNDRITKRLASIPYEVLPTFVDGNHMIAMEVIFKTISMDKSSLHRYMLVLQSMEPTVKVFEIVKRVYEHIPDLDQTPLWSFLTRCMSCIQLVQPPGSHELRMCRLLCGLISNLFKNGLLRFPEMIVNLQAFLLLFSKQNEAVTLYQEIATYLQHQDQ